MYWAIKHRKAYLAHVVHKLQISRDQYSARGKYYYTLTSLLYSFLGMSH